MKKLQRIAILRALQLGDMMCIIPTVRAIRTQYPSAHITLAGLPWAKAFVERFHHYFDAFVEFPGWPGFPERPFEPAAVVDFLKLMQSKNFDFLLQMQGNGSDANTLATLCGPSVVCGLRRRNEMTFDGPLFPIAEDHEHEVLRFLKLADALFIPRQGTALEFPFLPHEVSAAAGMLRAMDLPPATYVCVHPGARDPRRRWDPRCFAYVADRLATEGYTVLLTGTSEELPVLRAVEAHMEHAPVNLVDRFGQVGLGELAYILSQSALLFSNDTGVSHIAAALEIPSVIVFSNYSLPQRWAPLNDSLHHTVLPRDAQHLDDVVHTAMSALSIPAGC